MLYRDSPELLSRMGVYSVKYFDRPRLRGLAAIAVSVVIAGCGTDAAGPSPNADSRMAQTTPVIFSSNAIDTSSLINNRNLSALDRKQLRHLYVSAPRHSTKRPMAADTMLVMAFVNAQGHITKQLANRPGLTIRVTRDSKRRPCANCTGPYHQLSTAGGSVAGVSSTVEAPCTVTLPTSGEKPFVYLGGYTDYDTTTSRVEAGMQLNGGTGSLLALADWQPYIRAAGVYVNYEDDTYNFYFTPYQVGTSNGEWICSSTAPMTFTMDFFTEVTTSGGGTATYYECFGNYTSAGGTSEIEFAVCPTIGTSNSEGWQGWPSKSSEGYCTDTCYITETTSIAQPGNEPDNGAIFGPVYWSNLYAIDGTIGAECTNFPPWGTSPPTPSPCGTTPPDPANDVIQVTAQDIQALGSSETLTIDNRCPNWSSYTCDARNPHSQ